MMKSDFSFQDEELALVGHFLETSFIMDKEAFIAVSPMYGRSFISTYKTKLAMVKDITISDIYIGQVIIITEQLNLAYDTLIILMRTIENSCQKVCTVFSFNIKDLKLAGLRLCIKNKRIRSVVKYARNLQKKLNVFLDILEPVGYNAGYQAHLEGLITTIEAAALKLEQIKIQRQQLINENKEIINEFRAILDDIMDTGKLIHKNNPSRRKEYMPEVLKSKVNKIQKDKDKIYICMPAT